MQDVEIHHFYATIWWSFKRTNGPSLLLLPVSHVLTLSQKLKHNRSKKVQGICACKRFQTDAIFLVKCCGCRSKPVNHTLKFIRLLLLLANILFGRPESVAARCAGATAPSKGEQSGGNRDTTDVHSPRLSAHPTLRTCPRDAELRRPQVCAGCLFPHVKVIRLQQSAGRWEICNGCSREPKRPSVTSHISFRTHFCTFNFQRLKKIQQITNHRHLY